MANRAEATFRRSRGRMALAAAALVLFAPGCKTWHSFKDRTNNIRTTLFESGYEDPTAADKLAAAEELYSRGEYAKAQSEFKALADNRLNAADLAERARFMQAECRYARKQYPEAVDTYHKLLIDFPTGVHRRESCARMFQISEYWLEDFVQEMQARADEPGVQRWKPSWKNPLDKTRPLVGQEGRTLEALDHIWTHDMTGPTADKALYWCGYVNFVRGNFQEADHFFSTLVEMHKESTLRPQAIAYAIQAKNNATGGAEYDGRKCAEALQLVHMAEAGVPELTQDPEMAAKLTRARTAIRSQQAEKDLRMAQYFERIGHPGSAVFYYELVRRRYAGTRYSDLAGEKKEQLVGLMREGKTIPGNDPFAIIGAKWKEVFGPDAPRAVEERDPPGGDLIQAGGPAATAPVPVGALPPTP